MLIRKVKTEERSLLFQEGFKIWNKGRTFEKYCVDNSKEDSFGTRYGIEVGGNIVSSLILLRLGHIDQDTVYGIGSVLTFGGHLGNGYAKELIRDCMTKAQEEDKYIFLYSEINPSFYERFEFRQLPDYLQKNDKAVCMVSCNEVLWKRLLDKDISIIPDYF